MQAGLRLIVHEAVKDEVPGAVAARARARAYAPADPLLASTRMGTLVDGTHMSNVLSHIERGRAEGAKVLIDERRALAESGGFYVEPIILDGWTTRYPSSGRRSSDRSRASSP